MRAEYPNRIFIDCAATRLASEWNSDRIESNDVFHRDQICLISALCRLDVSSTLIRQLVITQLFLVSQRFAFSEIEFAGGEDRDGFDALDFFWNPQIGDAGFVKFFAQLREIDIYRRE